MKRRFSVSIPILIGVLALAACKGRTSQAPVTEPVLRQLEELTREQGPKAALQAAERTGARRGDFVIVVLEAKSGAKNVDLTPVLDAGAQLASRSENYITLHVPPDVLSLLRTLENVASIHVHIAPTLLGNPPELSNLGPWPMGFGSIESGGVALVGADTWHRAGIKGQGIRVAVVDGGFADIEAAIEAGELPANTKALILGVDAKPSRLAEVSELPTLAVQSDHGTRVAAQLVDHAPGVELIVAFVDTPADVENVATFFENEAQAGRPVHVANMSLGYYAYSYYDGSGPFSSIIDGSSTLWTTSAGNQGFLEHFKFAWADTDSDDIADIVPDADAFTLIEQKDDAIYFVDVPSEDPQDVSRFVINWNQYPKSKVAVRLTCVGDLDVDGKLDAFDSAGAFAFDAKVSETPYLFGGYLTSMMAPVVLYGFPFVYGACRIGVTAGDKNNLDFTVFGLRGAVVSPSTSSYSVSEPADARAALTVGAVSSSEWRQAILASYSSQGPTTDGRIKPDLVAPDNVILLPGQTEGSEGTSFSAPAVAGLAALAFGANLGTTAEEIKEYLTKQVVDAGAPGFDPLYGHGLVKLSDCVPGSDADNDQVCDDVDACPNDPKNDEDNDQICFKSDKCPKDPKNDEDNDGICGDVDMCPTDRKNDADNDQICDSVDPCPDDSKNDEDNDQICFKSDKCPKDPKNDEDDDGICGDVDVCPTDPRNDADSDEICDSVDPCPDDSKNDEDNDQICFKSDKCPKDPKNDEDDDGICGDVDVCPADPNNDADNDQICAALDNCPDVSNAAQEDIDDDGVGDACDTAGGGQGRSNPRPKGGCSATSSSGAEWLACMACGMLMWRRRSRKVGANAGKV